MLPTQEILLVVACLFSIQTFGYYCPNVGRWTTRDPIEEKGGANLYAFCGNNPVGNVDTNGCVYFAYRPLKLTRLFGVIGNNDDDLNNTYLAHENLFFEDGKTPGDLGYFDDGLHPDRSKIAYQGPHVSGLNDCIMRKAVKRVRPLPYNLLGDYGHPKYNCQDWAEDVLNMYYAIKNGSTYYPKSTRFIGGK